MLHSIAFTHKSLAATSHMTRPPTHKGTCDPIIRPEGREAELLDEQYLPQHLLFILLKWKLGSLKLYSADPLESTCRLMARGLSMLPDFHTEIIHTAANFFLLLQALLGLHTITGVPSTFLQ